MPFSFSQWSRLHPSGMLPETLPRSKKIEWPHIFSKMGDIALHKFRLKRGNGRKAMMKNHRENARSLQKICAKIERLKNRIEKNYCTNASNRTDYIYKKIAQSLYCMAETGE